jgi:hypothetical protein
MSGTAKRKDEKVTGRNEESLTVGGTDFAPKGQYVSDKVDDMLSHS